MTLKKPYLLTARESPKGSIPRLGIPEYDWGGNLSTVFSLGVAATSIRCPTSFPDPVFLGATFNQSIWKVWGQLLAQSYARYGCKTSGKTTKAIYRISDWTAGHRTLTLCATPGGAVT